jgi:hypothetical protein
MRILLVGLLSATLLGCSCLNPQQASLQGCSSLGCFNRTAEADPPLELKPAPFTPNPATAKVKSTAAPKTTKPAKPTSIAAKTAKPPSAAMKPAPAATTPAKPPSVQPGDENDSAEEKAPPPITKPERRASVEPSKGSFTTAAKPEGAAPNQSVDKSDPVLKKARTTVASKLENPASAKFEGMKRAMRKNTFGQSVDTICGHVRVKSESGEDTGERAFLYLVKEDEAYVVDGKPGSAAASAYRNICMTSGFARKGFPAARGQE